jgi:glycerol-3-phosphate dehydrogenase
MAVRPKVLVNATGAWVDHTNAVFSLKTRFMGGTKGSHLVVDCPALHRALNGQMVYYQYHDGRVCIVFPFLDKVIMGSTDIRVDDPETASCEEDEIQYMFTTLREVFPEIDIRREHIVFVYCGVRPLPSSDGVTANISRGHSVRVTPADGDRPFPLYSLIGGKWTTFRAFSEQVGDRILAQLGAERRRSSVDVPIGGGKAFPRSEDEQQEWLTRTGEATGLSEKRLKTLLSRYGTHADRYSSKGETSLKSLPGYTIDEIRRIVEEEYVEHLSDLVCRRTLIAITGQATQPVLTELAEIAGEQLGWDDQRREGEVRETLDTVRVPVG